MTTQDLKNNRNLIIERLTENNRVLKSSMEKIVRVIEDWKDVEPTEENILKMVDTLCPNPFKKMSKKDIKKANKRDSFKRMVDYIPSKTDVELQNADEERRAEIMKRFNQEN